MSDSRSIEDRASSLKWSKYNYAFQSKKKPRWVLYNSFTGAIIALDHEDYAELMRLKDAPELASSFENFSELAAAGFFVNDGEDDRAKERKKRAVRDNRGAPEVIDLTIAPTLSCNFGCPYCFQNEMDRRGMMSPETIENTIKFAKTLAGRGAKALRITWFGGEPLLALDQIELFTRRAKEELKLRLETHVVTNGYLLDENAIRRLDAVGVTFYQITLDGSQKVHDRRRPLHGGRDTFNVIVENVKALRESNKDVQIAVRVNIDRKNADDYHAVDEYLKSRLSDVRVYPGFVDDYAYSCKPAESDVMERDERARFLVDQFDKHGIYSEKLYPTVNTNSCMARYASSFLVGPQGGLYKCLSLVGVKKMEIGSVNNAGDAIEDRELMEEFLHGEDYLDNPECNDCLLFPVCDGGCPYLKIKEGIFGDEYDTCHVAKGSVDVFLEAHLEMKERLAKS